jgi:hypothetical protein
MKVELEKLKEEILECEQQIDWLKEHYSSDEEEDNYYDNLDYEIECYENKISGNKQVLKQLETIRNYERNN